MPKIIEFGNLFSFSLFFECREECESSGTQSKGLKSKWRPIDRVCNVIFVLCPAYFPFKSFFGV